VNDRLHTLSHGFDWRTDSIEWPLTTDVGPGLDGVVAAETRVAWLDPSSGQMSYRGVPVAVLAAEPDFEAVAYLLLTGQRLAPEDDGLRLFRRRLRASRVLHSEVVQLILDLDPTTHPTRLLRAGVSALGCHEMDVDDDLSGSEHWRELRIVGQVAALVATIARHRQGRVPLVEDPQSSLAEGVLEALTGRAPTPDEVRALDLLLVLYAAHGLDAPTMTSLVVASCLADPYTNVVAGLSALRGPRQGGASERVLEQVMACRSSQEAERWVEQALARGERIAGFGHRRYHMPDPRVVVLRQAVAALSRGTGRTDLFAVTRALEGQATRLLAPRGVHVNINLYGAVLLHLLGAEPALCPCLIAVARMAGMVALVREALGSIRLYRPRSHYAGVPARSMGEGSRQ
jgi:citrate synthase